jgi:high affinity Mn2+ porin
MDGRKGMIAKRAALALAALLAVPASAADAAWYLTATNVTQWHPPFRSSYMGVNSLDPHGRTEETSDLTLYAGARAWRGAEVWLNAEIDQGHGVGNGVGIAGYPSGEAKIGQSEPYVHLPRLFLRQVFDLSGEAEELEGFANQLAGGRGANHLVLTVGRFSLADIFDSNAYAHDPRADFLNYALIDAGALDYASDPWGFTNGVAAEWTHAAWTLRAGAFQLPRTPNARITARVDFGAYTLVGEVERRYRLGEQAGKVKLLAFMNRARMARYDDALELARRTATVPDVSLVRRDTTRAGMVVNLEHEISQAAGVFARASVNEGAKEAYEYTDINRSLAAGLQLKGYCWGRPADVLGVAAVVNALSRSARDYFAAGGIGIVIGDGALNYRTEQIVETFYAWRPNRHIAVTLDAQHVRNPAYNADRGPVNLFAVRTHIDF